ncbi:MAG: hypothetical protein GEU95_14600 [Rhizobiales bacterium]|nr:hypothetical protein [Hyphomicrobiales bacterium]
MMKRTMLPFLAVAVLALHPFSAAAQNVPTFDVGPQCSAQAKAAPELGQACLADEKKAREDLVGQWAQFAPDSKARCTQMATGVAGIRSYVELLTCLQIAKDVKGLPKE